ncbi:MAG: homoserine dehydrogenase [Candidatus Omnitrophica bacterium]|nr:homoserine dehydrogenase [Candidatus Omnitrophota bacterium]
MKKIKIGLIGFGTIGSGVIKALISKKRSIKEKSGLDISVARICDKDLKRKRPVKVSRKILTKSVSKLLYDPGIDIIVELMGGVRPARDIVLEALRQGKHVVTANKALLSDSGYEIFKLANELKLCVGFEASVGGGMPIIRALKEGFVANRIDLIYGIINGTSNFILSKMAEEKIGFEEALAMAQAKGYAERDPRLDIEGGDSCHKLSILALLGFGIAVKPSEIYTEGITEIEASDIQFAKEYGYAIKLLAIAKRSGKSVELRVHPTLIPAKHLLASVGGVYNAIFVKGDLVGENLFYGQGAGAAPTSSAVVSDIVSIAKSFTDDYKSPDRMPLGRDAERVKEMTDVKIRYYVRFSALDKPGVLAKISGILAKYDISIASVTQLQRKHTSGVPIIMMTHEALERDMMKALKEIDALKVIKKKSVRIRVEG